MDQSLRFELQTHETLWVEPESAWHFRGGKGQDAVARLGLSEPGQRSGEEFRASDQRPLESG